MKTRQLDRRSLMSWFWCAMLWGAIGAAVLADKLPLLPS